MLIHIGEDIVLQAREIVALIDLVRAGTEDWTAFLDTARREGQVQTLGPEDARTAVITQSGTHCQKIYLSPITVETLIRNMTDFPRTPSAFQAPIGG
ncbi:MAG: DUF370 domain-containing protein [Verrucomicrobiota bacterium]|jgi:hypothetical protein|nr:DUF370 domain-containing protein [Verrucomicrobiota bacterium]